MCGQLFESGHFTGQGRGRARHPIFDTDPRQGMQIMNETCIMIRSNDLQGLAERCKRFGWACDGEFSLLVKVCTPSFGSGPLILWFQWMISLTNPFTYQLVEERIIDDSHDRDTLVSKTNRCSHHGKSMHLYLLARVYRCMEWMAYKIGCTVNGTGERIRNDVSNTIFPRNPT